MEDRLRDALLRPTRVALIGASGTAGRITARPQTYMAAHGFPGEVIPVNPGRDEVLGARAWPSIDDVPGPVDHAYILLNADPALAALEACGRAGVPVVSMLADGFAEAGPEGAARQARLVETATRHGIALLGPNSMGVVAGRFACTTNPVFANPDLPVPGLPGGRFAVISQSGSIIGALASRAAAVGLGFRAFVSTGNEACLGVGEIGQTLVDAPEFDGFVLFLETLRRPDQIARFAARAAELGKPLLAYLVGRSEAGSHLAASHTGAMAGGARAIEAFLAAHGIRLLDNFEALAETAHALALAPRLTGRPRRVTVVTTTGGGGGMVFDRLGQAGVALAGLPDAARGGLAAQGIAVKPGALVDVTLAGAQYNTMRAVIEAAMQDPETGLIVAAIGSSAQFNPEQAVTPIVDALREGSAADAPVVAVPIPNAPESLALFNAHGVPAFRTVEAAAEGIATLLARPKARHRPVAAGLPKQVRQMLATAPQGALLETEAGAIFEKLGIAVPPSMTLGPEDVPGEIPFPGPYALKLLSRQVQHKTEIGGVTLHLADQAAVTRALADMRTRLSGKGRVGFKPTLHAPEIDGFLVQQMAAGGLGEAIIGLTRDPVAGPMISFGMGGVMTEIYRDIALRPAPVSFEEAVAMFDDISGFALFRGWRGGQRGDLAALARAVAAVSQLATEERVAEAEINPVLVLPEGHGILGLDALVTLRGGLPDQAELSRA